MSKLLVFCIDALCSCDVEQMREMPHFGEYMKNCSLVRNIHPVWPALTYCCHTSIITGCYVDRHGVDNNEKVIRGGHYGSPWYGKRSDVKVPTLLDRAREHGMTTCSLSWPVSGGADYDMNMPMIVPYGYIGYDPTPYLKGMATDNLMDRYFYKHGRYIKGPDRSLDLLTMALALDILEDYEQPDVMLVKMCDLDGARHTYGVHHERVQDQLRKHDEEFGAIIEALRRKGTLEETNIVILGDHGQTDITAALNINILLRKAGFIRLNEDGSIADYDAIAHSACLCAYIELKNPDDAAMKTKVRAYLESLKDERDIMLDYVYDKQEAQKIYRVAGDFDFIIESRLPISFCEQLEGEEIFSRRVPGDHKVGAATHGGNPSRRELTTFIAAGPDIKPGVEIDSRSMVDEAPTMARMLGFTMPEVDGKAIEEILR